MTSAVDDDLVGLRPVALAPPELVVRAVSDGLRLGLVVLNGPTGAAGQGLGQRLRDDGASWNAARRMWVFSSGTLNTVMARLRAVVAQPFNEARAQALIETALAQPQSDYFAEVLDAQLFPLDGGGFALRSHFDPWVRTSMRALQARFHPNAQAWEVRQQRDAVLRSLLDEAGIAPEFVYIHSQSLRFEELGSGAASKSPLSVAGASPVPSGPLANKDEGQGFLTALVARKSRAALDEVGLQRIVHECGLRDYQIAGVRFLAERFGALLGDDMGLGKTRQSVVAARLVSGAGRVLVACPASLAINWEREIHAVFPEQQVCLAGQDRPELFEHSPWVVCSYERLGLLAKNEALAFSAMICDEAHYLKEHKTGRTLNAFILAGRIERVYLVTGTPLLNREIELHTLLRLSGHPLGEITLKDFRTRFVGDAAKRAVLADALSDWMLRRSKGVLAELGAKERQLRYVDSAEGRVQYQAIMDDMTLPSMPKLGRLRACLETIKTEFALETALGLSAGDKLIIFCEYLPTVSVLRDALRDAGIQAVSLVGKDSAAQRQQAIDTFQSDPAVTVFIGTISAAGVGHTLTAANWVLFLSIPWTPGLLRQAEDRAYRMGQKRLVTSLVPIVPRTIDEQIWQLVTDKKTVEDDVVTANEMTVKETNKHAVAMAVAA